MQQANLSTRFSRQHFDHRFRHSPFYGKACFGFLAPMVLANTSQTSIGVAMQPVQFGGINSPVDWKHSGWLLTNSSLSGLGGATTVLGAVTGENSSSNFLAAAVVEHIFCGSRGTLRSVGTTRTWKTGQTTN